MRLLNRAWLLKVQQAGLVCIRLIRSLVRGAQANGAVLKI
jgi:hypothetical protein